MIRSQRRQFTQRLPPASLGLVRQPRNQIKADIPNPRLAQNRHGPVNIRPPVYPPRRNQFLVRKRLQPKAHAVNSRPHPCRRLLSLNRLRVRLQRHLHQVHASTLVGPAWSLPRPGRGGEPLGVQRLAAAFPTATIFPLGTFIERHPNHIQNVLQMSRIKQARRPPANVNRVHYGFVAQPLLAVRLFCQVLTYPSRSQQIPMLPYLPANRFYIWRKTAAGHYSRVKITVGTLRLAERHLHVNPELPHRRKTLAHPRLNPGTSKTMDRKILRRDFLGNEADIPNTRLADFVKNPLDVAIPCASIGPDIELPIRSILNALSDPIRQFVHCDHSIAIENSAVPRNIRVRAFIDGNRRRGVRHIQIANAVTYAGRRDNFLHMCEHIYNMRASGCLDAWCLQGILSPERRILACGN